LRYFVRSYVTKPTTINAITDIPAKMPRPIGSTEIFLPGIEKADCAVEDGEVDVLSAAVTGDPPLLLLLETDDEELDEDVVATEGGAVWVVVGWGTEESPTTDTPVFATTEVVDVEDEVVEVLDVEVLWLEVVELVLVVEVLRLEVVELVLVVEVLWLEVVELVPVVVVLWLDVVELVPEVEVEVLVVVVLGGVEEPELDVDVVVEVLGGWVPAPGTCVHCRTTSTRGSPFGPVTGVKVNVHVSVTGPELVSIVCSVWVTIG